MITKGDGEVFAECSGNLLYFSDSPFDLPTTGDWIYADFYDDDSHAIIHGVLPRRTLLKRKTAGELDEQRYKNYVKMKTESAFHDMPYSEKRKKDKDFGKMVKSVMKSKKKTIAPHHSIFRWWPTQVLILP